MASAPLRLADFEITGPLGSGATSRVLAAIHKSTHRDVAIKMLEPAHRDSAEMRVRLQREAVMLSGVTSPHVARVFALGYEEEQPFLVLERLHGETLAEVLKRDGRISVDRLAPWIEQLLIGIRDCHDTGVIHRDVKPANIFLASTDGTTGPASVVKLIDFGVARLKEIAHAGRSLTSTHHLLGSMGYMAPEQFQYAKGAGPQADVYAIGVVLFRCVTGRLPFVSRSFDALIKMKLEKTAPRLSTMPGVAKNELFDGFVATALQPHPSSRFDNGKQMLEAWWRVAAALDRESLYIEDVEVEFEDDIEVSTDVIANLSESVNTTPGVNLHMTLAELESTTVNRMPAAKPVSPPVNRPSGSRKGDERDGTDD